MQTSAIILERPGALGLAPATLRPLAAGDVLVDVEWSGISSGTERLLWSGRMPSFPGMGYPLVPGYETVGRVVAAGDAAGIAEGARIFVPGATAFSDVRSLFGGAARRLVVEGHRCVTAPDELGASATLFALAATAVHIAPIYGPQPELIVGHGVLGRLLARLAVMAGTKPVVWERDARRRGGGLGYDVIDPQDDDRRNYERICDVSGSVEVIDTLIGRLAKGGELLLAGFYDRPISFAFPPAFQREARLRIAAQWQPNDLATVAELVADERLSLDHLISHERSASDAETAYRQAFDDVDCLKMCLDWRSIS